MKLNEQGELLLVQLLNLIDKLPLHAQPLSEWDGQHFSENIEDFPSPAEVPDSPARILAKGHHSVTVVPTVILDEVYKILTGRRDGQPGLEDYVSGEWREDD